MGGTKLHIAVPKPWQAAILSVRKARGELQALWWNFKTPVTSSPHSATQSYRMNSFKLFDRQCLKIWRKKEKTSQALLICARQIHVLLSCFSPSAACHFSQHFKLGLAEQTSCLLRKSFPNYRLKKNKINQQQQQKPPHHHPRRNSH